MKKITYPMQYNLHIPTRKHVLTCSLPKRVLEKERDTHTNTERETDGRGNWNIKVHQFREADIKEHQKEDALA